MNKLRPILITGGMGAGKTSAAEFLFWRYQYIRCSMAGWIKQTVTQHYGIYSIDKSLTINGKPMRTILQEIGMYMRNVDPDWHIDEVIRTISDLNTKLFVIDDIRFVNEVTKLNTKYPCIVIKIECNSQNRLERLLVRDKLVPTEQQLSNASEIELNSIIPDYTIINDGTIDDLHLQIEGVIHDCQKK